MGKIIIKKGLDLPISGEPQQQVRDGKPVTRVALVGDDYIGMKPTMAVQVGDKVKLGQVLFSDKKTEGIKYTSPGTGTVVEINRGAKRHFESIVIELEGDEEVHFTAYGEEKLDALDREEVRSQLVESGVWTSLRARPFSKVADPKTVPHSLFITATDTNPLAPSMVKILEGHEKEFINGLKVVSKLTDGKIFVCKGPELDLLEIDIANVSVEEFSGIHPAGNVGTHIHFLDPVNLHKTVWHIGLQDVIAIGYLFVTGKILTERIISLAGPAVKEPSLIKTRLGAYLPDLVAGELIEGDNRIISGSVFSGRKGEAHYAYLGRYHQQVSVLREGRERRFFGWALPSTRFHSVKPVMLSALIPGKKFDFTTELHGGERAIVPVGSYEKVMPLDILPNYLLRSLAVKDIEESEKLGCLELDEEDLALCTYVCPSKIDHGANLRETLTLIEKEG